MADLSSEAGIKYGKDNSSPKWSMREVKRHAQLKFVSTVERIMSISRKRRWSDLRTILTNSGKVSVTVGPVIGKVTDCTARVLLEVGEAGDIVMHLEEENELETHLNGQTEGKVEVKKATGQTLRKYLHASTATIFAFDNLKPGTRYQIKLGGCYLKVPSSFRTFPKDNPSSINFAVISCNKIFITEKEIPVHSDLWAHLEKSIRLNKIDMCLHLGDQIYGDGDKMLDAEAGAEPDDWSNCFKKSTSLLSKCSSKDQWTQHYDTICEYYREVYRRTWRHSPTAYCLANCPNLMIYDDHEIRDNWADLHQDWKKETIDFFIALCAWRVSLEYQRQLHEDVDFSELKALNKDYHFHLVGRVGIMFIDIRGSRSFYRCEDPKHKYLGSKQWEDIDQALSTGGLLDSAEVLLLCTPAPLVFLDHNFTDVAANVPRLVDFKGHWSVGDHYEEQKRMIDKICEWKETSQGREVLVLGGDVHCGGHSDIIWKRSVVIRQLTTSAIANHPLPKSAYYLLRAAGNLAPATGRNFTFRHHNWTRSRNYGLVQIKFPTQQTDNTRPEVISQLIRGKFMIGIREGKKVSTYDEKPILTCESWFCPIVRRFS